jgi:catechol 1,2-dioxygenase
VENNDKCTLDCEYNVRLVSKKYKPDSQMIMTNANVIGALEE